MTVTPPVDQRSPETHATPVKDSPTGHLADRPRSKLQTAIDLVPALMILVGGWLHRWTNEDAYINLRVVDQIVAGHGPVFNAGERVEAFTSPLWLAILVLVKVTLGQFVAIEWAMVGVSLAMAAGAFWLAVRSTRRLHPSGALVVPIGLLAVAAVPVVWDFATSGLEMALVWLWVAGSWTVLVGRSAEVAAAAVQVPNGWRRAGELLILGLGPLIRPDLGLMSVCLLAGWLLMVRPRWLGLVVDLMVAFAPAIAYQVFRMGYYASLVPSTALAKDAGGTHVGQGVRYVFDLSRPYALWIPLLLVVGLIAGSLRAARRSRRIAIGAVVAAATSHAAYLVIIGGDYMHGRLLLPALFAFAMPAGVAWTRRPTRTTRAAVVTGGVVAVAVVWSVTTAGWLRYQNQRTLGLAPITSWREISPRPLVRPRENPTPFWTGTQIHDAYERGERGTIKLLDNEVTPTGDPNKLVVILGSIGLAGYDAGVDVIVVDIGGLSEPTCRPDRCHRRSPGWAPQAGGRGVVHGPFRRAGAGSGRRQGRSRPPGTALPAAVGFARRHRRTAHPGPVPVQRRTQCALHPPPHPRRPPGGSAGVLPTLTPDLTSPGA